ncbi:MAG: hypothetical protein JO296_01190 [Pseudonocardiales bacterium]|jgi:hypothetical protein|nr:hypothetical protein [Pseudonocardiales bacterium]
MRATLPRGLRMTLLTAHITAAALWLGINTASIALTAAHTAIPAPLGAAMLTSSAATTLGTGFVLAAHRPWGLRRHHWIITKLRISTVLAAAGLTSLSGILDPLSTLAARICALIALITTIAVSVTKPWGLTQHGHTTPTKRSAHNTGTRKDPPPTNTNTPNGNPNPANTKPTTERKTQRTALINQA